MKEGGILVIQRIIKFYFTGTDRTKIIINTMANRLAKDLDIDEILDYNFTTKGARKAPPKFQPKDLVLCGLPTIAGRVPNLMLPYLERIQGNGAKGIAIMTFGNRSYDDSLMELYQIMKAQDIQVLAGGAFVGEHSFSKILAKGRPDLKDLEICDEFAQKVGEKIKNKDWSEPKIKGNWPLSPYYTPRDRHGKGIDIRKVKPKTKRNLCIDCKICAEVCPMEAIDHKDVSQVPGICMKCCACEKKCPTRAKYFDDPGYLYHARELEELYDRRAEPEYFL